MKAKVKRLWDMLDVGNTYLFLVFSRLSDRANCLLLLRGCFKEQSWPSNAKGNWRNRGGFSQYKCLTLPSVPTRLGGVINYSKNLCQVCPVPGLVEKKENLVNVSWFLSLFVQNWPHLTNFKKDINVQFSQKMYAVWYCFWFNKTRTSE